MSYSTIKAVYPGKKVEDIEDLRNSWGTATIVWDALFKKYVPKKHEYDSWLLSASDDRLWKLVDRDDIPANHRLVLAMTFDRAYVLKRDYARAAADLRRFFNDFPVDGARVNHWPHIVALFESDPEFPAIGFRWTSVSRDPFLGPYNEEKDDCDPLDWTTCWSLYDEIDAAIDAARAKGDGQ